MKGLSQYNIYNEEERIVYNSLNKKIAKLSVDEWRILRSGRDGCSDNQKLRWFQGDEKENEYAEDQYKELFDNNRTMMVTIIVTGKCNLRCAYCYEDFQNGVIEEETQQSILAYITSHISEYDNVEIGWFGGEPLLAYDTILKMSAEISVICAVNGKTYHAGMTTNGVLLSLDRFDKLLSVGIKSFHVTVDCTKVTHDRYRQKADGTGSYEIIWKNIVSIIEHYRNNEERFRLTIRSNIDKNNVGEYKTFCKQLHELVQDDDRIGVQVAFISDYGGEKVKQFEETFMKNADISDLRKCALDEGLMVHDLYDTLFGKFGAMCYVQSSSHIAIGQNGKVFKCTLQLKNEDALGQLSDNGNISDWHGGQWTQHHWRNECLKCCFFPLCYGGCCPYRSNMLKELKCPPNFDRHSYENILPLIYKRMSEEDDHLVK